MSGNFEVHGIVTGRSPGTWDRRVEMAEESGFFTPEEKDLAYGWSTCAVGEIGRQFEPYETIPVDVRLNSHVGTPVDDVLRSLGMHFGDAVCGDDPHLARILLDGIHLFLKGAREEARTVLSFAQEGLEVTHGGT